MCPIYRKFWIGILLAILLLLGTISSAQEEVTTVSLPFINLGVGDSGVIEVEIDCAVEGCSAYAVTVTFDPDALQVDEVEIGPYLGEQIYVAENVIDNEEGVVRVAVVAMGDPPAEPESNVLFQFTVTALVEGGTILEITEVDVGDLIGNPLEVETVDGAVFITAGTSGTSEATPEVTPEATTEPEATEEAEPEPCWVRNDDSQAEIYIRVGPGFTRGTRAWFPFETDVLVVGQYEDDDGNIWWRIQPEDYIEEEADRYWVAEEEVDEIGDCEEVIEVPASGYVRGSSPQPTSDAGGQTTTVGGQGEGTVFEPIWACIQISDDVYQWYEANVTYDANGNVVSEEIVSGPWQGEWREGCGDPPCEGWVYVNDCAWPPGPYTTTCKLWRNTCTGQQDLRSCRSWFPGDTTVFCPAGLNP